MDIFASKPSCQTWPLSLNQGPGRKTAERVTANTFRR